jgi:hypothetical protein
LRPTIRNVSLKNTTAYACGVEGAILEDIVVDSTKAGKAPVFLRGNVYKHVVLKGRLGPIEIRGKVFPPSHWPIEDQQRLIAVWDKANAEYYTGVDWALDITNASFGSFSISGVPSRLIRRDPENTAVVTLERAKAGTWRNLALKRGLFFVVINMLLDDGYPDALLIACPRSTRFSEDLEDLELLRRQGIAE